MKYIREIFESKLTNLTNDIESEIIDAELFQDDWKIEFQNKTTGTSLIIPCEYFRKTNKQA